MGNLTQNYTRILVAFARASAETFAAALVVARTQSHPRRHVGRGGEAAHVRSEFADRGVRTRYVEARDSVHQHDGLLKRGAERLDARFDRLDAPVQLLDMFQ